MRYIITSDTLTIQHLKTLLKGVDASVEEVFTDQQKLLKYVKENPEKYREGLISAVHESALAAHHTFDVKLTDQVRYNGADIELMVDGHNVWSDENTVDKDKLYAKAEVWTDQVCGDMLEDLGAVPLIMLFGLQPREEVLRPFKEGQKVCSLFEDMNAQTSILSNYEDFVNRVLNGDEIPYGISYDVYEGTDS